MPYVLKEMRRVRILFRIAIGMVHAVHDCVGAGIKKRRALGYEGEQVKKRSQNLFMVNILWEP